MRKALKQLCLPTIKWISEFGANKKQKDDIRRIEKKFANTNPHQMYNL